MAAINPTPTTAADLSASKPSATPASVSAATETDETPAAPKEALIELDEKNEATVQLLIRDLQEVLGENIIRKKLKDGERLKCYWGTAPTGKPHIGYFVPLTKIADFLHAGVEVKVLLADIHAFLDAGKSTYEQVGHRVAYYSKLLHAVFTSLGVPTDKLQFVTGSEYQLKPDYNLDQYRLCAITTLREAMHAGAEVVKQSQSPMMSSLLYPGLQALDEQYLDVDFQFGGVDQRKIFIMAEKYLPRLGYKKRAHLMNAMVPGLAGGKMSSSDPNSKVDFLDSEADVKKKISKAFCEKGNVTENGLLSFMKAVVFPIQYLRREQMIVKGLDPESEENRKACGVAPTAPEGTIMSINRPEKYGGPIYYSTYQQMEDSFAQGELGPPDLKSCAVEHINLLLDPIRKAFETDEEFAKVRELAYPTAPEPVKEEKKKIQKQGKQQKQQQNGVKNEGGADKFKQESKQAATKKVDAPAAAASEATSIVPPSVGN